MQTPPRITPMFKLMMGAQVFLLRRNLMGPMGNIIMVITTTGRKSGKQFSTPIGYQRDGDDVIAFNLGGGSNWYKNMLANPLVTLNIKGRSMAMRGTLITDQAEVLRVIDLYLKHQPDPTRRFLGFTPEMTTEERVKVAERIIFVRFRRA
jgi:deazaflavin-dependent oxidoreductase (nitroreductase family)